MNKISKECRNIVILVIIFLLLLSILLIVVILIKDKKKNEESNEVLLDYSLITKSNYYRLYEINDNIINNFNITIDSINITHNNDSLCINDECININKINNKFAKYDDTLVFLGKLQDNKPAIIKYSKSNQDITVIDKYDNMFLYNIDQTELNEAGLVLYLTNIKDNKVIINNNEYDVCSYTNNNTIINKSIFIYYDIDKKDFTDNDIISKEYIKDIKKDIC